MALSIDITAPRMIGRAAQPLSAEVLGPLTAEDIALLSAEVGIKPSAIKRLSERHHMLARLLATGATDTEAGITCGYTPSRISILKGDPSFRELVEFYRKDVDRVTMDMQARLAGLSVDAIEELRARLEDDPDSFGNSMLLEIVTKTADRSGNGPTSKQEVNVNVNLADRLQAARERAAKSREAVREIEGTARRAAE